MQIDIKNSENYSIWIDSYTDSSITIDHLEYNNPISIIENKIYLTTLESPDFFSIEEVNKATENKPEIIIIGTGSQHLPIPIDTQVQIIQSGIGLEVMNTPSACKVFNLLIADGRKVWAWFWMK